MNKSIMKNIGQTKSPTYGVNGVDSASMSKNSSIMGNKFTKSARCGYGVNGVDAGDTGNGPKRSSNRAAGAAPS